MNSEKELVFEMLKKYPKNYLYGYFTACFELQEFIHNGIDYNYCLKLLDRITKDE